MRVAVVYSAPNSDREIIMRSKKSSPWQSLRGTWTLVLFSACLPTAVAAQQAVARSAPSADEAAIEERIQELSYKLAETGEEISYSLFVPSSYEPTKKFPLIVLLHGLGSNPGQVMRYDGLVTEAEQRGYLVVAPYGYNSHGWYGSLGQGNEFAQRFRRNREQPVEDPENLGELSEKDVLNVLEIVTRQYSVDPTRTYLMGHSMGGGGTLYLAMKYSDKWAAIGPMAPAIYSDPEGLKAIAHLPAIVVQGEDDRLVRAEVTRRWVEMMKELEMTHRYIEIPGGDHVNSIARNPEVIDEVFDFFDQHRRPMTE